jgi:hypothetical protein
MAAWCSCHFLEEGSGASPPGKWHTGGYYQSHDRTRSPRLAIMLPRLPVPRCNCRHTQMLPAHGRTPYRKTAGSVRCGCRAMERKAPPKHGTVCVCVPGARKARGPHLSCLPEKNGSRIWDTGSRCDNATRCGIASGWATGSRCNIVCSRLIPNKDLSLNKAAALTDRERSKQQDLSPAGAGKPRHLDDYVGLAPWLTEAVKDQAIAIAESRPGTKDPAAVARTILDDSLAAGRPEPGLVPEPTKFGTRDQFAAAFQKYRKSRPKPQDDQDDSTAAD